MRNDERESLAAEIDSGELAEDFRRSQLAVEAWERRHPASLDDYFRFLETLRALFGDPPVNTKPWRGDDFRL